MQKRDFLRASGALAASSLWPFAVLAQSAGDASATASSSTVLAAWHQDSSATQPAGEFVGLFALDWQAAQVRIRSTLAVPTRTHGLLVQSDGGFVAVAVRPGNWIVRCDAQGQAVQWLRMDSESEGRTLDGHVCASADGQWLYTAETSARSGQGWVSVRDSQTLRKVAQWRTYGVEPHQLLLDASGKLMVANGGILRAEGDKKRDLHLMDSSLVRMDPSTGERLGQWRLKDQRLGIRHMAWSQPGRTKGGEPATAQAAALGIALQNEHDDVIRRRASPVFAVWDGDTIQTPALGEGGGGYSGDIVASPDGGFVLSCLRTNTAFQWNPKAPEALTVIAQLQDAGALTNWPLAQHADGVFLGSARGVARWHPSLAPVFLKWPVGLALDNHWALVG
ncbi:MAG: DUF1513 domain-containing protein [Burkholderiales bacterium]|nr:DUF1513 domain-containing protein [Burkholderiales bacterium]